MKCGTRILFIFITITPLAAQWGPDVRLTSSGKATLANTGSVAASLGGLVHVVWADTRNGNSQIYYRRASSGGMVWGSEMRLTNTQSNAHNASVSIAGAMNPVIHVVWEDDRDGNEEIYYKRSTDWGMTWVEDTRLTTAPDSSVQPMIQGCVCCGAYVRVVWVDKRNGNADIYYKYSTDNGVTWREDIRVTDNQSTEHHPSVAFACSLVQTVWTDAGNGRTEIWGRRSVNEGKDWDVAGAFSGPTLQWAEYPNVVHFDSSFHLLWIGATEESGQRRFDLFHRRSTDLGAEWQQAVRLSRLEKTDTITYPSCTILGSALHLTWARPTKGVYYLRSTDDGAKWDSECRIASAGKGTVWAPSVAVEGQNVHVVWGVEQKGKANIFYKRNPTGNPVYSK